MNLGTKRLRGRPRNRWQDEVREDGRIVGGEGWQEKVYNREELREAAGKGKDLSYFAHANGMNELIYIYIYIYIYIIIIISVTVVKTSWTIKKYYLIQRKIH